MDDGDLCYTSDTNKRELNGRAYLIENRAPVLTDDEKLRLKEKIGAALFDIFSKYR